jgi:prepilin-type processing-associated H-X9-DG protein
LTVFLDPGHANYHYRLGLGGHFPLTLKWFHPTEWADCPASYHNGSAGIRFADGHAVIHKWPKNFVLDRGRNQSKLLLQRGES